ncbi:MAG: hypothetical protein GF329_02005 [Candidatus Lokiarchaeota archaeon]|nr:hypothetical protein [Candidatus Lokiarchaeota archaeon]
MKNSKYDELQNRVNKELQKEKDKEVRKNALNIIRERHEDLSEIIDKEKLKKEYKQIKKYCLNNLERLKKKAFKNLRENECKIYEVSSKDALNLISQIMEGNHLVKSKTNVSKELNLVEELNNEGIDVIETDLGDRLVQLAGIYPAHPVLPSLCISNEEAYELLTGKHLPPESEISIDETVKIARSGLREKILEASVALTGANVITADEGFIGLIENEGNQRLITSLAKKHIIITSIDKIVRDAQDAITIMKTASFFGLGIKTAGYFSFISGPSKTGDIESTISYGMHGPEEVHVIFINNNRSEILNSEFKDILMCCSCGNCVNYCPIFEQIGGNTFGGLMPGGRGVLFTLFAKGEETAFTKGINLCATCGACTEACPGDIDIAKLIMKARKKISRNQLIIPRHREILESINKFNNPFNEQQTQRINWINNHEEIETFSNKNSETLLFIGCMSSFRTKNQAMSTFKLLKLLNIDFDYLGSKEPCCGGILYRLGYKEEFKDKIIENTKILNNYKRIILLCPGCYSTFKKFYSGGLEGVEIKHIIELLPEDSQLNSLKTKKVITYHDPCHLTRELEVINPPRITLNKIADFKEMKFNGINSRCCGAGGGVMSAFPKLSQATAATRIDDTKSIKNLEYILTSCPFCEKNLKRGKDSVDSDIKIMSIQEFIINLRENQE